MKIYHQAGHNTNWNLESLAQDSSADGIIFSPVHYAKNKIENIQLNVRKESLFDPQFYIPDSQKLKLQSYEFFPEKITEGFSTVSFESLAFQSAEQCLDFQIQNEFESLLIPARYFPDMVTDFIDKQKTFTVDPFLDVLSRKKSNKNIFITLPVTVKMTQDIKYREQLLNWITSYPEITGVYFLNQIGEVTKQISKYDNLINHINFIKELQEAELKVIVGYCNTEALLLSCLSPYAVTIGAYENTRNFTIDKFLDDENDRRGPAARIYFPKLCNWVRYTTAVEIKDDFPDLWQRIYSPTPYMDELIETGETHFTKPGIYKHHFKLMGDQLRSLALINPNNRISEVQKMVLEAINLYDEIRKSGILFFDENCEDGHLKCWNRVLRNINKQN